MDREFHRHPLFLLPDRRRGRLEGGSSGASPPREMGPKAGTYNFYLLNVSFFFFPLGSHASTLGQPGGCLPSGHEKKPIFLVTSPPGPYSPKDLCKGKPQDR